MKQKNKIKQIMSLVLALAVISTAVVSVDAVSVVMPVTIDKVGQGRSQDFEVGVLMAKKEITVTATPRVVISANIPIDAQTNKQSAKQGEKIELSLQTTVSELPIKISLTIAVTGDVQLNKQIEIDPVKVPYPGRHKTEYIPMPPIPLGPTPFTLQFYVAIEVVTGTAISLQTTGLSPNSADIEFLEGTTSATRAFTMRSDANARILTHAAGLMLSGYLWPYVAITPTDLSHTFKEYDLRDFSSAMQLKTHELAKIALISPTTTSSTTVIATEITDPSTVPEVAGFGTLLTLIALPVLLWAKKRK
ncbi:hypothetical protein ES703_84655 [subsurface metagenome]